MATNPFAHLNPDSDAKKDSWEKLSPEYIQLLEQLNQALFNGRCELVRDIVSYPAITIPNVGLRFIIPTSGLTVYSDYNQVESYQEGAVLAISPEVDDNLISVTLDMWEMRQIWNVYLNEMVVYSNKPRRYEWNIAKLNRPSLVRTLSNSGKQMYEFLKKLGYL